VNPAVTTTLRPEDWRALRQAYRYLEHPALAAQLATLLGTPLEHGARLLPRHWHRMLETAVRGSTERVLALAVGTLRDGPWPSSPRVHMALGAATGAVAGAFGLAALLLELPIATALMMRVIAGVAQAQGESLDSVETRAECIKVFAFGGPRSEDDAAETGYYGLRVALAVHFSGASPSSIGFARAVAKRFGAAVSDKAAAQLVPVAGAICGALVNAVFIRHFHNVAWGHFTVRRLERICGAATIRAAYEEVRLEDPAAAAA
jgi:hypothetical protein